MAMFGRETLIAIPLPRKDLQRLIAEKSPELRNGSSASWIVTEHRVDRGAWGHGVMGHGGIGSRGLEGSSVGGTDGKRSVNGGRLEMVRDARGI